MKNNPIINIITAVAFPFLTIVENINAIVVIKNNGNMSWNSIKNIGNCVKEKLLIIANKNNILSVVNNVRESRIK